MLELDDRDDLREPLDPLDERILDDLAEPLGEAQEVRGRQRLVAEEDDAVLEPGLADGGHGIVVDLARIDASDLRAERAGDGTDLDCTPCHFDPPYGSCRGTSCLCNDGMALSAVAQKRSPARGGAHPWGCWETVRPPLEMPRSRRMKDRAVALAV